MKVLKIYLKRILVILMVFVTLMFFCANSLVHAKSSLPSEGEFYYSGTSKMGIVPRQGIFDWLIGALGDIMDWLLGIASMLVRMVFVGWTALIEKLLTWVLESTMNMNMEIGDVGATNVSANMDSSRNVTVEAIVYGLVPIFDINVFDLTLSNNITGTGIDLSRYVCEKCGKGIDECVCNTDAGENCSCNLCELREYYNQGTGTTNAVLMVKEAVSKWYYIIRLIALVAMLIVLLGIGIKMTLTSIASDKALYKRMLVDWVVGMVIIFFIHYAMIAIINLNDVLVSSIRNLAYYGTVETPSPDAISSLSAGKTQSVEITLYEEVRTRAYDPKLINGLTGMVLYATLVYFAIRYSLVYLKRYFTIIVLTLMAPGIGVAYAIQKALTGKSSSFSTWLKEYILNTIIQFIHAILYSAFVTMALKLALESVSGMIIAFIIMNFMLKAEALFKKIFKMSSSAGLLNDTENAAENTMQSLQNAVGVAAAAKPIAGALKNTVGKVAAVPVKAIRDTAIVGGSLVKKKIDEKVKPYLDEKISSLNDRISNNMENGEFFNNRRIGRAMKKFWDNRQNKPDMIAQGLQAGGYDREEEEALKAALYADMRELRADETEEERKREAAKKWGQYSEIKKKNKMYKKATTKSSLGVFSARIGRLLDYNNYFIPHTDEEGQKRVNILKDRRKGKWVFDENTKKPVFLSSIDQLVGNELSAEKLLGIGEQEREQLKQVSKFVRNGLLGVGSMFVGLGTCVAHPKMGMALLAGGAAKTSTMLGANKKKIASSKRLKLRQYVQTTEEVRENIEMPLKQQRFTFARFNSGALMTMQRTMQRELRHDKFKLNHTNISRIRTEHPNFVKALEKGEVKAVSSIGGLDVSKTSPKYTIKPVDQTEIDKKVNEAFIAELEKAGIRVTNNSDENKSETEYPDEFEKIYKKITYESGERPVIDSIFGGIGEEMDKLSLSHFKAIENQEKKEKKVAVAMISDALEEEYLKVYSELGIPSDNEEVRKMQEEVKPKTSTTTTEETKPKTRDDIKDVEDITTMIEVALYEEASATRKDVSQLNTRDVNVEGRVKKAIESMLREKNAIAEGQKVEDVVKDIDKQISKTKSKISKPTRDKKETIKDILRQANEGESEQEFIKRITGFDVDADVQTNIENQSKSKKKKEKVIPGLTSKETDKVLELLLLQKQMRELNAMGTKLKMGSPSADARRKKARALAYSEVSTKNTDGKKKENKNNYGPVTDIIGLIEKL